MTDTLTLHHLEYSQSFRVLWMLEELQAAKQAAPTAIKHEESAMAKLTNVIAIAVKTRDALRAAKKTQRKPWVR